MFRKHLKDVHVRILDERGNQSVGLFGGLLRALDRDGPVALHFALLFDLDVSSGGGTDGIDVASGPTNHSGDGMHWDLDLLALHDRGRALLYGALADDLLPTFLALHRRCCAVW